METILDFFNSSSVWALIIAATIFVITLVLVIKRLIGFFITLLLLAFTIVSGYAVYNHDLVRQFLQQKVDERNKSLPPATPGEVEVRREGDLPPSETTPEPTFQEKIQEAYEKLKIELEAQKIKLQEYLNKSKEEEHNIPPANQNPSSYRERDERNRPY